MGTRWILEVTCPQCGFEDDDVPFAPTCDFVTWKCPECGFVVDLIAMTGISYEDASSADEIKELCSRFGSISEILEQSCETGGIVAEKQGLNAPLEHPEHPKPTTIPLSLIHI